MLTEFYEKNEVPRDDMLLLEKDILITVPEEDFDLSPVLGKLGLSKWEVAVVWPKKSVDMLSEICAASPKLVIQVGRKFFKKFSFVAADGSWCDVIDDRVKDAVRDKYVILHHHDEFSMKDALGTVKQLIKVLKAQRRSFCCVTNHGSVGGWVRQYNVCRKAGVKAIFGMEAYVSNYRGDDPEMKKAHRRANHLILLAVSETGFYNIIKIHNDAQINGFYYTPRVTWEACEKWGEGVVATSACMAGEIPRFLMEGEEAKAEEAYRHYAKAFDKFYIEIQMIEYPLQQECNKLLIEFAKKMGAPLILACDSHYLEAEQSETHDLLMCLRQGKTILDKKETDDVWSFDVKNLFYRDHAQMREILDDGFSDAEGVHPGWKDAVFTDEVFEEAMANTREVALMAEDIELDDSIKLPKLYDDAKGMLRKKVNAGFVARGFMDHPDKQIYLDRVNHEFKVIVKMGWPDYFLVMDKIIAEARVVAEDMGLEPDWAIGYGRGSAAGSLVSYCLGLTEIDPIEHGLLFERFLDEGRPDPPDIDTDFDPRIRDRVKQRIIEMFGEENVCSIGTYSSYKTSSVILDVTRALGLNVIEANAVTKKMDPLKQFEDEEGQEHKVDELEFDELVEHYPELKVFFEQNPEVRYHSEILRNQVKNMGKHAGGVIISDMPLEGRIPVLWDKASNEDRQMMSAWAEGQEKSELSSVGLVKFDLLGLKNLPIISDCVQLVRANKGIELKRAEIPIDDKEAIKMGSKDDLVGIFQLENPATKPVVEAVGMESLADVSAITSLIRPGPRDMGMDMEYANRKNGTPYESIPCIEHIMQETYGVMTYQEQMMKISQVLCGFDGPMSNKLRKACGKKIASMMESIREKFIEGAQPRIDAGDVVLKQVEEIWDLIAAFARYSFNKTIDKDELVVHSDGHTTRIEDVEAGDKVVCFDGCEFVETEVVARHDHGRLPAYEYVFDDGSVVVCTANHKFLTSEGQFPIRDLFKRGLGVYSKGIEKLEVPDMWGCVSDQERSLIASEGNGSLSEGLSEIVKLCGVPADILYGKGMQSPSGVMSEGNRGCEAEPHEEGNGESQEGTGGTGVVDTNNAKRDCQEGICGCGCETRGEGESVEESHIVVEGPWFSRAGGKECVCNGEGYVVKARDSEAESREPGSMERGTSRGVSSDNQKGTGFSEKVEGRALASGETGRIWLQEKCSGPMREQDEASRLCETGDVDRGGRGMALRSGIYTEAIPSGEGSRTRFDVEQGGREASINTGETGTGMLAGTREKDSQGRLDGVSDADGGKSSVGGIHVRRVLSERSMGFRQMYDLEVSHPSHNFCLASGLVTSNSHAVTYSAISTVEMWLKYHYLIEYVTALINNTKLGTKKHGYDIFVHYINYARRRGIDVLSPDISKSKSKFTIDGEAIRFSLAHVKNVASQAPVIESFQPILSIEDFHERVKVETVGKTGKKSSRRPNKKVVESLVAAGSFDEFGTRDEVMAEYYRCRKNKKEVAPEYTDEEWIEREKEVLGLCLSQPPLYKKYEDTIKANGWKLISEADDKKKVKVFGQVQSIKPHVSRKGSSMYIVHITDGLDVLKFYVFQGAQQFFRDNFKVDTMGAIPMDRFDDGGMRFFDDRGECELTDD